jgi:hypothetical protein
MSPFYLEKCDVTTQVTPTMASVKLFYNNSKKMVHGPLFSPGQRLSLSFFLHIQLATFSYSLFRCVPRR